MKVRAYILIVACTLVLASLGWSQTSESKLRPYSGEFKGHTYRNHYFGMIYVLPEAEEWYVNDDLLKQNFSPSNLAGHFWLTVLDRHTGTPIRERILIMADDAALYDSPMNSPEGFVAKLTEAQRKTGHDVVRSAYAVEYGGRQFYRGDFNLQYTGGTLYKSSVSTQFQGFLISWTFVASSPEQLDRLVGSLSHVTFNPPRAPVPSATTIAGTAPARRIRISEMVLDKFIVERPVPPYPKEARSRGVEGLVRLKIVLTNAGELASVQVVEGDPLLIEAALDAVRYWRFKPYILNGEPVEVESQVTIQFRLPRGNAATPNGGR
ncbi:MAG TPA: energy transducer TonB [Terriglobales bacterium]|nr:energy transducer TonB [Terriglobales bacterium]